MSTEYPPNVCRISAECLLIYLPNVFEYLTTMSDTSYFNQISAECLLNILQLCQTVRMSNDYPPNVCRISTECLSNICQMSEVETSWSYSQMWLPDPRVASIKHSVSHSIDPCVSHSIDPCVPIKGFNHTYMFRSMIYLVFFWYFTIISHIVVVISKSRISIFTNVGEGILNVSNSNKYFIGHSGENLGDIGTIVVGYLTDIRQIFDRHLADIWFT